jgi:lambda family phage portal protein
MKAYLKSIWRAVTGKAVAKPAETRGYRDVLGLTGPYADWAMNFLSEDADLWQNQAVLRDRSRDLFKTDCYFRKYKEELFANVHGEDGLRLRMKVKEESDRVVYAADEKSFLDGHIARMERIRAHIVRKGLELPGESFLRGGYHRAKAMIQAGALDLYACTVIENAWKEWQRKEFCTMTGKLTYNETRNLRLLAAARDGDFFIRKIEANVNKFGFSLQLINSEWCDFNLNVAKTERGTSIRMGVEMDDWGRPIAYHFIKKDPWSWQYGQPGWNLAASKGHERIEAKEIIHYVRHEFGDSTRGAPWTAAVIQKSRQLDKFEEAEVIAARVAACKMGFLESDLMPEGGQFAEPDPCKKPTDWDMSPGGAQGLPFGVKFKEWNPNHPTQNFDAFRRGMLRSWCAGLPGADYNVIANDLENINFSAGRLGRLDTNEMWKLLQRFDIETAERPIFEAWLEMALISGAIPLPYAKINKFNKPHFTGRRWAGVDPIKETQAAVLAIQNRLMSYSQWFDENGKDLEEVWMEIAEEQMLAEELGIELPQPEGAQAEASDAADDGDETPPKKKPNGTKHRNGDLAHV